MKKITLYQALEKKKLLEKKVSTIGCESFDVNNFITFEDGHMMKAGKSSDDIRNDMQSYYDKNFQLAENLSILKIAITMANATTNVTIGDKTYTIAEAIMLKNQLPFKKKLYGYMRNKIHEAKAVIESSNERNLSTEAESEYISKLLGNAAKDTSSSVVELQKLFRGKYTAKLFDPLNFEEMCKNKLDELDEFQAQLAYSLNKANIETLIEIPDNI